MRYVTAVIPNVDAAGTVTPVYISMNGLFKPEAAATGHQPLGFDQYMEFYNHYTVLSAKIKITPIPGVHSRGFIYLSRDAGTVGTTNRETLLEQASCQVMTTPHASDGMAGKSMTDSVNLSQILGQDVRNEDANAGTTIGNPTEQYYWHLNNSTFDGGAVSTNILVEVDYRVLLHEPKAIGGS